MLPRGVPDGVKGAHGQHEARVSWWPLLPSTPEARMDSTRRMRRLARSGLR
jgi:hypothetical protein